MYLWLWKNVLNFGTHPLLDHRYMKTEIGRGFESCLGTIVQWFWESYLHMWASVTTHYNLVPVKGRWHSEAAKVTVGLAMHWPCVTDFVVCPPTGSRPTFREMSTPPKLNFERGRPLPFTKVDSVIRQMRGTVWHLTSPQLQCSLFFLGIISKLTFIPIIPYLTVFRFLVLYAVYSSGLTVLYLSRSK